MPRRVGSARETAILAGAKSHADPAGTRPGAPDRCAILRRVNALRPLATATLTALACALVAAAPAAAGDDGLPPPIPTVPSPVPGYLPDPYAGSGTLTDSGAWVFSAGGISMRLSALDDEGRWAWLRARSGAHADPFGVRGRGEPKYVALLVELRNDSAGVVAFNPDRIWLTAGGADIQRPLDQSTMQSAYRMHDREMPPAFERAAGAVLQGDTLVQPGGERVGLLVFRALEGKPKAFTLEIPLTTGAGDVVEFRAAWLEESRLLKKTAKEEKKRARARAKEAKDAKEPRE